MREPEICKGVLERLLHVKIDRIDYPELQKYISPFYTRYYQSMIDIDSLLKGAVYSELKESYVIFICTNDPFEAGLPVVIAE